MRLILKASINGTPAPQGSMAAGVTKDGRPYVRHNKPKQLNVWRDTVRDAVAAEMLNVSEDWPINQPIAIEMKFYFKRPQSHYLRSGTLRPDAPVYQAQYPDADKIVRSTFDAITYSGFWIDDKLASIHKCTKYYVTEDRPEPGVDINVYA